MGGRSASKLTNFSNNSEYGLENILNPMHGYGLTIVNRMPVPDDIVIDLVITVDEAIPHPDNLPQIGEQPLHSRIRGGGPTERLPDDLDLPFNGGSQQLGSDEFGLRLPLHKVADPNAGRAHVFQPLIPTSRKI